MDLVRNTNIELKTLSSILELQANDCPDAIAVATEQVTVTYSELFQYSNTLATQLSEFKPHTVALLTTRSPEYLVAYFAILKIGAIVVPIDIQLTPPEIQRTLDYCKTDLILHNSDVEQLINSLKTQSDSVVAIEFTLKNLSITDNSSNANNRENRIVASSDTALMLHTSGSLTTPKRVMLTHEGLINNARAHCLHLNLFPTDKVLIVLPMYFGYCNTAQIIAQFLLGGTLFLMQGLFTPKRCLQLIEHFGITSVTVVPSMLIQLQESVNPADYNLTGLKQICFGGAPFPVERLRKLFITYPNVAFCQTYGLTEAGPRITGVKPDEYQQLIGSVGTTLPGVTIKILKEPNSEIGEIIVKSAGLMKGYFERPQETAEVLQDGWLYTGDLGWIGSRNELYLAGRRKNIIIKNGVNIYPEEIESVLLQHPAIQGALVYGKPHPIFGESVHADVVIEGDAIILAEEIKYYLRVNLAGYKIPSINIVSSLLKTYNGKIKRHQE